MLVVIFVLPTSMFLGSFVIAVVCGRFVLVESTVMRVYIIRLEAEGVQLAVCARCTLLNCEAEGDWSDACGTGTLMCPNYKRGHVMLGQKFFSNGDV